MKFALAFVAALFSVPVLAAEQTPADLVSRFWQAGSDRELESARADLLATTQDVSTLYRWLKLGPTYASDVPRGKQESARRAADGTLFRYVYVVPESYDPAQSYPVEFMLHGGVSRPEWEAGGEWWRRGYDSYAELEQITVLPASWSDTIWWQDGQADNLPAILREIKQTYNVDDNRVYLSGVSDGGTGTYFFAFKQPTPWAAFLPFIGHPGVLRNAQSGGGMALYFENLMDRSLFIVNGEKDPLYPASSVQPFIDILREAGINHEFTVIPDGGHNTNWLPDETPRINAFKQTHVRDPFPDSLIWVTDNDTRYNRNAWIRVDELATPGKPGFLKVSRDGNVFSATAEQITTFSLLLNPEEIDFGSPIAVSVNGRLLFSGQVSQSAETLLDHATREKDRLQLVTAELSISVPN